VKLENLSNLYAVEDDFYNYIKKDLDFSKMLKMSKMVVAKNDVN